MTSKEYTQYLLDLSDTYPEALEVADTFGKLSENEQEAYLEFI